ncbi:MAG: DUF1349 domain-containing protein [Acidobacteriota bacterium]
MALFPHPPDADPPSHWNLDDDEGTLTGIAPARTDLFSDPFEPKRYDSAPTFLFPVHGDFIFQACVTVDFSSTFDAGVLLLFQDYDHWAKLCFERSPIGQPTIVSVVNRGISDDANAATIDANTIYLRIARRGPGFAFHYSRDASYWHMVRGFQLLDGPVRAGFLVQSPQGPGCRVRFTEISCRPDTLADIRNGE